MNAYYNSFSNSQRKNRSNSSENIRKAYIANSRKAEIKNFFTSLASGIDSKIIWNLIFTLKIIGGIVCAISFFAVIGMIESTKISPVAGIMCTVFIALLESLCFIPLGKRPLSSKR